MNAKIEVNKVLPIVKGINGLIKEATFKVNSGGLSCVFMDYANVELSIIKINQTEFISLEGDFDFSVRVEDLYKILKEHKNKVVDFSVLEQQLNLNINGFNYSLPLIFIEARELRIPDLNFNADLVISTKDFKEVIKSSYAVSEALTLEFKEEVFKFKASGDLNKVEGIINTLKINKSKNANLPENALCKYSLEYLKMIFGFSDVNKLECGLMFCDEYPLKVVFENKGISVICILAPRVEDC